MEWSALQSYHGKKNYIVFAETLVKIVAAKAMVRFRVDGARQTNGMTSLVPL